MEIVLDKRKIGKHNNLKVVGSKKNIGRLKHDSQEEFEDPKGVIRIRKLKKDRQHNGQKKDKQRSTNHTHKTKDQETRTSLKSWGELRYSGRLGSSCFTSGTRRFTLIYKPGVNAISPSLVINQLNPKLNTHLCRGP